VEQYNHSIENESNDEVGHEYEIDPRGHTVRSGRKRIQHQPGDKFGHVYSFFAINFLEGANSGSGDTHEGIFDGSHPGRVTIDDVGFLRLLEIFGAGPISTCTNTNGHGEVLTLNQASHGQTLLFPADDAAH